MPSDPALLRRIATAAFVLEAAERLDFGFALEGDHRLAVTFPLDLPLTDPDAFASIQTAINDNAAAIACLIQLRSEEGVQQ